MVIFIAVIPKAEKASPKNPLDFIGNWVPDLACDIQFIFGCWKLLFKCAHICNLHAFAALRPARVAGTPWLPGAGRLPSRHSWAPTAHSAPRLGQHLCPRNVGPAGSDPVHQDSDDKQGE